VTGYDERERRQGDFLESLQSEVHEPRDHGNLQDGVRDDENRHARLVPEPGRARRAARLHAL
jgi:hypothetical protein